MLFFNGLSVISGGRAVASVIRLSKHGSVLTTGSMMGRKGFSVFSNTYKG